MIRKTISSLWRRLVGSRNSRRFQAPPPTRCHFDSLESRCLLSWASVPPAAMRQWPPRNVADVPVTAGEASGTQSIFSKSEIDWYRFTSDNSGAFTVRADTPNSTLNTLIAIYDSSGRRVAYDNDSGPDTDSVVNVMLPSHESFYVGVTSYRQRRPRGEYNWQIDAPNPPAPPPTPVDNAGNSPALARNLGALNGVVEASDFVGAVDSDDYYRFTLDAPSEVTLSVAEMTGDTEVQLIRDGNENNQVDSGELIAASAQPGDTAEQMNSTLEPGTYYIRLWPNSPATNYTLQIHATRIVPPDQAGNQPAAARSIDVLDATVQANDFVGVVDPNDYYRFTVDARIEFSVSLSPLSGDADLQLIRDDNQNGQVEVGEVVTSSMLPGRSTEQISSNLEPGTYYVRVSASSPAADYALEAQASRVVPPDQAGNEASAAQALDLLNGTVQVNDFVGLVDPDDYYRFALDTSCEFVVSLTQLTGNADLQLIRNDDENGPTVAGQIIAASTQPGNAAEQIIRTLEPGSYYLRVYASVAEASYTLRALASRVVPPDQAGNQPLLARNLGGLNGPVEANDFVGIVDPNDYYRFTIDAPSEFTLSVSQLTANADVQLVRDGNANSQVDPDEIAATSAQPGSSHEQISRTLEPGVYFVRVFASSPATNYTVQLQAIRVVPPDAAGDQPARARDMGALNDTVLLDDFIGIVDPNDYYRFTIDAPSDLVLSLSQLTANADVQLIRDGNQNSQVDAGEIVAVSAQASTAAEQIRRTLQPGTYFVWVYTNSPATNYALQLQVTLFAPPDQAGNNPASARNLGLLNGTTQPSDFVGIVDPEDYYRFNLDTAANFSLILSQLAADADVQLVRDADENGQIGADEIVAASTQPGNLAEQISRTLEPGTYFVRVYADSPATNYTLRLQATRVVPPDEAGNRPASARNLGELSSSVDARDFLGIVDSDDYYRFTLDTPGDFTLLLSAMTANADVQLIRDINENGLVDFGEITVTSAEPNNSLEQVTRTLDPGIYFVRVYTSSPATNYTLQLQATRMYPRDEAGNQPAAARNLGALTGAVRVSDFVGTIDTDDYYRFTLDTYTDFNLALSRLTANADVQLIRDGNHNGLIDAGEITATSTLPSTTPEQISRPLDGGTYYVRVYDSGTATNYVLDLNATPAVPPDLAGHSLVAARNLGTLNGTAELLDFVGNADTTDFYRFTVTSTSDVTLLLSGLGADADVHLIWDGNANNQIDFGEVIDYSIRPFSETEWINRVLGAGTYFVKVFQYEGDTNYVLDLAATATVPLDFAGSWPATAWSFGNLDGSEIEFDFVGTTDPVDTYRFTVNLPSDFSLWLTGLSADADVRLVQDGNGNGSFESWEEIARSERARNLTEHVALNLWPGTYFVQVFQFSGDTSYTLELAAPPQQVDNAWLIDRFYEILESARQQSVNELVALNLNQPSYTDAISAIHDAAIAEVQRSVPLLGLTQTPSDRDAMLRWVDMLAQEAISMLDPTWQVIATSRVLGVQISQLYMNNALARAAR